MLKFYFNLLLLIIDVTADVSFNQPKFCPSTTWNSDGVTFANVSDVGQYPNTIFIDTKNTIYVAANQRNQSLVWSWVNNSFSMSVIAQNFIYPNGLFVSGSGDIYISNNIGNYQVDRWFSNGNHDSPIQNLNDSCAGLFIDKNGTLYCSMTNQHAVFKMSLNSSLAIPLVLAAGNGSAGSSDELLNSPHGIFVDSAFNLFVADANNNRIQRFSPYSPTGIALVPTSAVSPIQLSHPTSVTMDANDFLYVCDSGNHRIIEQGPNGLRCIIGCTGFSGSAMNQLNSPHSFSFDNLGNIYVNDRYNHRIQKFLLFKNSCGISYNRPQLCSTASWEMNAITFATNDTISRTPWGIFIDMNDSIYVMSRGIDQILVWNKENFTISNNITVLVGDQTTLFADTNGDIYYDYGNTTISTTWMYKWSSQSNASSAIMSLLGRCYGLFVDIYHHIYCSMNNSHLVIRGYNNLTVPAAGNGTPGDAPNLLSCPRGIFVTLDRTLYVADCGNNRIQLFKFEQINGTTVFGNSSFTLHCPNSVVLDYDGNLFITDSLNSRIISSGPNGHRCIAGCSGISGSAANQLSDPRSLSFDSYGNLFVCDGGNNRIQMFLIKNNSCHYSPLISTVFVPSSCPNSSVIGPQCNITTLACNILNPCLNQGTCLDIDNTTHKYICLCSMNFSGEQCEVNLQLCQPNPCRNGGLCRATSNTTFVCEQKINYCENVSCLNEGVCRSLSTNYRCECLVNQIVARGLAFVAIIVMAATVLFIVFMDILKYWFGIDTICKKLKKKRPKRKILVLHLVYVN